MRTVKVSAATLTNDQLIELAIEMEDSGREHAAAMGMPECPVLTAWQFVLDNEPASFGLKLRKWPSGMPDFPPHAFILAYYTAGGAKAGPAVRPSPESVEPAPGETLPYQAIRRTDRARGMKTPNVTVIGEAPEPE